MKLLPPIAIAGCLAAVVVTAAPGDAPAIRLDRREAASWYLSQNTQTPDSAKEAMADLCETALQTLAGKNSDHPAAGTDAPRSHRALLQQLK